MNSRNLVLYVLCALFAGCASTPNAVNDINVAHNSCYSYIYGENGFELNYEKAFEWCTTAAALGESSSQTLLAELYLEGNGVAKNLPKAAELYEKAAVQDHPHAQLMVFVVHNVYRADESSVEEKTKGLLFLRRAKDAEYPKAIEVFNKFYGQEI